jgi:ATP-dependent Lhr-like helicase
MAEGFDLLHPAVQHHVVNSMGWRTLRPLQAATVAPILAGEHLLAMAPTAGGKTEAAILPVLSRMLSEDWRGLTVIYVCPLRALLNNLHVRLSGYAQLVGRTVGLWHGDVTAPQRRKLLADPPDILLTTPESLESMLVSTGVAHDRWFANLQTVIIDEAHAFAGDDRGWHLLAVLAKVSRLAGRELQRIALSATIGNPDDVLEWLTTGCSRPSSVINPPAPSASPVEIVLDYVGSLDNAALVLSRLHRGSKRLVFVDSRSRAEKLAATLRAHDVTTFLSHGSLGFDERRQAEAAFADARDCVIVATSTLELGIDVGDLDHVIQIDAPPTVASLLQRLGRAGRREGTRRNLTLLATDEQGLLFGSAVLLAWSRGYIEPVQPPPMPLHLVGQQVLALALQEHQIGNATWKEWLGSPFALGTDADAHADDIVRYMLNEEYLVDTGGGMLTVGVQAEAEFGRKHFMELMAVFTSPPLFAVRHGRNEIGHVPDEVLLTRPTGGVRAILLAGRNWEVIDVDWRRRVIAVEPSDERGVARWMGGGGFLGWVLAQTCRDVLTGTDPAGVEISRRANDKLAEVRAASPWARPHATVLVTNDGRTRWWTFAGGKANTWFAAALEAKLGVSVTADGLSVSTTAMPSREDVQHAIEAAGTHGAVLDAQIDEDAINGLKFADLLPLELAKGVVAARLAAPEAVAAAVAEPVHTAFTG